MGRNAHKVLPLAADAPLAGEVSRIGKADTEKIIATWEGTLMGYQEFVEPFMLAQ